jgi:uncharacterized protein YoxC
MDRFIGNMDRLLEKDIKNLVRTTNESILSSASNLNNVSKALIETTSRLKVVLDEIEGLVKESRGLFPEMIRKSTEDIEEAGVFIRKTGEVIMKAEGMIKAFEGTALTADSTIRSIEKNIDLQSRNLYNLISTINETAEELQEVLMEIKNKPWSIIYRGKSGTEE